MKRFFGTHRDEDYGQIRYLTAKCSRLAQEKAVLEREFLVAGERERTLRKDLEAVSRQLCQQEQLNVELRVSQDQLLSQTRQQKELVEFLQQHLRRTVEEGSRDTGLLGLHLEQLCTELQQLQDTEVLLESLVEELQRENQSRAAQADALHAQLNSGMQELEAVQNSHQETILELETLKICYHEVLLELDRVRTSHQETMMEMDTLQTSHQETLLDLDALETTHQETVLELDVLDSSHQASVLELESLKSMHMQSAMELQTLRRSHQKKVFELVGLRGSHHETVMQLEELQRSHQETVLELKDLRSTHEATVQELEQEKQNSLRKLQETAEQFEWLCDQQRKWMCYVKRYKDCMSGEKDALLKQMGSMEKELITLRKSSSEEGEEDQVEVCSSTETKTETQHCENETTETENYGFTMWDSDIMADLQTEVEKWRRRYEELYIKLAQHQEHAVDTFQKPP
ncbi:hyaluronan mediated motility receptor isoform X2 [Conger conger]|uniref:hyaluronan mediated motility receptor isoform X2 n=1 Tax=Conger conger TaxID=82655 RepID=UPI002A5A78E4|nr:hyaluronan mediated motility receptor isoform X2 [Conger conger]